MILRIFNKSFFERIQTKRNGNYRNFSISNVFLSIKKKSYWHQIGEHPFVYKTYAELVREAGEKFSDRNVIISSYENKSISFKELNVQTDKIAVNLLKSGFKKGDRIGICGTNSIDWMLSFISCTKIGAISVLLNPAYEKAELEYCLNKVQANGLIINSKFKEKSFLRIIDELFPNLEEKCLSNSKIPTVKNIFFYGNEYLPGSNSFDSLKLHVEENELDKLKEIHILPDDPMNIQLSSGTTGNPKAAVLSNFNFVNNSFYLQNRYPKIKNAKLCNQVPFFHAFGTVIVISTTFHNGQTLVIPSKYYNPKETVKSIFKEKCTNINGTPTMLIDLVESQKLLKYDIDWVQYATVGGASCPPELYQKLKQVLGIKRVVNIYGLTETTAAVFESIEGETEEQTANFVGKVHDHIEVKVVDEKGNLVNMGEPGELCVRGYSTMIGYWQDLEKTNEMIGQDGWLKTGDQFVLYENGYGKVVGRIKDMIIRGGENIFPVEIENVINEHPNVIECHVIGAKHNRLGEEVIVCVRLEANTELIVEDLNEFCKDRLAKYKIPKFIQVVDDFPKTQSGKVKKNILRQLYGNIFLK